MIKKSLFAGLPILGHGRREGYEYSWYKVPTWDGSPATWRSCRREMSWWVESLDLERPMKYNLAARWFLRQSGVVRQRGEEFTPKELEAKKAIKGIGPATGTEVVLQEAGSLFGLNKLLDALEGINGKGELDKKGELREQFYNSLKRKPGERISEFCTRFRTLAADLRSEGIQSPGFCVRRWEAAVRELVGPAEVCQLSVKICSSCPRFST